MILFLLFPGFFLNDLGCHQFGCLGICNGKQSLLSDHGNPYQIRSHLRKSSNLLFIILGSQVHAPCKDHKCQHQTPGKRHNIIYRWQMRQTIQNSLKACGDPFFLFVLVILILVIFFVVIFFVVLCLVILVVLVFILYFIIFVVLVLILGFVILVVFVLILGLIIFVVLFFIFGFVVFVIFLVLYLVVLVIFVLILCLVVFVIFLVIIILFFVKVHPLQLGRLVLFMPVLMLPLKEFFHLCKPPI